MLIDLQPAIDSYFKQPAAIKLSYLQYSPFNARTSCQWAEGHNNKPHVNLPPAACSMEISRALTCY